MLAGVGCPHPPTRMVILCLITQRMAVLKAPAEPDLNQQSPGGRSQLLVKHRNLLSCEAALCAEMLLAGPDAVPQFPALLW